MENQTGSGCKKTGRSQKETGMKRKYFFLVFLLSFAVYAAAQQSGVYPTVSQIRVEARNNLIRLTWVDSPDARGNVFIFRSVRPFVGTIPANIRPITVRYGQQYYIDDTDDMVNIYYFIAASDTSGRRYDVIIPQTNSTYINLSQPQTPVVIPPVISAVEPAQNITGLTARQEGERIIITYEDADPGRNAILYRSTQPLRQPQDLLNANIVRSRITFPFMDFPVPGFLWYYAVVYEDEISTGSVRIWPGINATVSPVIISGIEAQRRTLRPIPLPIMTLNDSADSFFLTDLPLRLPLTDVQGQQKPQLQLKTPRVFVIDLESPAGGEDSVLFQIVSDYFIKFDWEGTRDRVLHYLSLPRSREVEARARFYLAQSFYYTGNYREALFQFLTFRTFHSAEANSWIDAVLTAMVY
jgi:hypothetical protein